MRSAQTLEDFGFTEMGILEAPVVRGPSNQNKKLKGSSIVDVPELEGAKPCMFMQGKDNSESPLCPGCWAAKLWKVRASRWKDTQSAPTKGLLRLGNWKEITIDEWRQFKAGRGTRANGEEWVRPDFPTRPYFVITRGLHPMSFYEELEADPLCLNIQVSVDHIVTKKGYRMQIPKDGRLRELLALPKVLLRYKTLQEPRTIKGITYENNILQFQAMHDRLSVEAMRVLETPLRLGDHSYQTMTPLERAGWSPQTFNRCNSSCETCPSTQAKTGENRVLGCAVTVKIRELLERIGNADPHRIEPLPKVRVPWTRLVREAMEARGGTASVQELYGDVRAVSEDAARNPMMEVKVRQVVQRIANGQGSGVWALRVP